MKVKNGYDNGECPDCSVPIDENAEDGDECDNCGHVFWGSVLFDKEQEDYEEYWNSRTNTY